MVEDPIYASSVGLLQYGRERLAGDFDRAPLEALPPTEGFKLPSANTWPPSVSTWLARLKRWIRDNL